MNTTLYLFSFFFFLATVLGQTCFLGNSTNCDLNLITAGINSQIFSELNSMGYNFTQPDSKFVKCPGFSCYLTSKAAAALEATAESKNDFITLSSATRTPADEYLLYKWFLNNHQCDITDASPPGTDYESGCGIDVPYYNYWNSALVAHGFVCLSPSTDPVYYTYQNCANTSSQNLKAFQMLWNRNNPNSQIPEDGIYGPETATAFYNTPCDGW